MNVARDAIFERLSAHRRDVERTPLRRMFADDPHRFARMSLKLDDLLFDYSKTRTTPETISLLVELARACDLEGRRDAMFSGAKINTTEGRAVLHTALRAAEDARILVDGQDVMPEVLAERRKAAQFAEAVRSGALMGATGERFCDIVNIGIGGSDLGPAMAATALTPYTQAGLRGHFVSNVDGAHITDTLRRLDPARTLVLVASKTFTTLETMANAHAARGWLVGALGEAAVGAHFAAISTNVEAVEAFGMSEDRMFRFWDWVGGRYSIWSVIGLSLTILIGAQNFQAFLDGGREVDEHFRDAPLDRNIPALMGLLGVWHRNVWGFGTHAVLPYDQRLARFPAYLQQLDMESNGKRVTLDGAPVERATGPIVWGEPGTNGQHAFYQLLHQGADVVPADILMAALPHENVGDQHAMLLANALAQGEAFMKGRTTEEAAAQLKGAGKSPGQAEELAPHKTFPGDRPTCAIAYRTLDPRTLGRLIALYEHKVFTQGVIWGINSFDQWGVELGKELASRLIPVMKREAGAEELDSSTRGLVDHLLALQGQTG
ncbi:glucose-6-phosphate isomerase [Hansschlegelia beijingensis]|uniref:Glucose-6-phosphate isomerase n=1 Tax=Hansschlegelia beijingensis TaxID=1133344 RepID=A0A7W6CWP0_9HYPH|nr:glucose-6-phosphate isomerase [Hansschlegelia beijingensis]MBB3972456.1 glucose-6-phosphate isomerase [Hansschlegelia beijingensis]